MASSPTPRATDDAARNGALRMESPELWSRGPSPAEGGSARPSAPERLRIHFAQESWLQLIAAGLSQASSGAGVGQGSGVENGLQFVDADAVQGVAQRQAGRRCQR